MRSAGCGGGSREWATELVGAVAVAVAAIAAAARRPGPRIRKPFGLRLPNGLVDSETPSPISFRSHSDLIPISFRTSPPLSHSSIRASLAFRRDSPIGCFENATAALSDIELPTVSPRAARARRRLPLRNSNPATPGPHQAAWDVFISWYNQRIQRLATATTMTLPGFPA